MRFLALTVVLVAACSSTPGATHGSTPASASSPALSPVASPTPSAAAPGAYAVLVQNFLEGGDGYVVSIVATDGHTAAQANARRRSQFIQLPNLSTSLTTLYYLDGDGDVRYLRPNGSKGLATSIALAVHEEAVFAVSPDDRRIAVSVLDYTSYPVSTRLYVEDLASHANHLELFSSKTVLEWPAGWHHGRLVMALGIEAHPQNAYEGFMRGHGYHVADATTGNRLLSLCDGGDSYVPESPAGIVCVQYPNVSVISWDGASRPAPKDGTCAMWGPLSPDGLMANRITATPSGQGVCRSDSDVFLVDNAGTRSPQPNLPRGAAALGWIDAKNLVLVSDTSPNSLSIVDTTTGAVAPISGGAGFFATALPGEL